MTAVLQENRKEALIVEIHKALGGNGWAYANYGGDELKDCREGLERVADLMLKDLARVEAERDELRARLARLESAPMTEAVKRISQKYHGGFDLNRTEQATLLDAYRAQSVAITDANNDYLRAMWELDSARSAKTEVVQLRAQVGGHWFVVRALEQYPIEAWQFADDEAQARAFFADVSANWTETFLCRIVAGPGNPQASIPLHPLQADLTTLRYQHAELERSAAGLQTKLAEAERDKEMLREGIVHYRQALGDCSWISRLAGAQSCDAWERKHGTLAPCAHRGITDGKCTYCGHKFDKPREDREEKEPEWRRELERLKNDRSAKNLCLLTAARLERIEPLEKLRRVVLSGQGEVEIPESVQRMLFPGLDPIRILLNGPHFRQHGLGRQGWLMLIAEIDILAAIDAAGTKILTQRDKA